MGTVKALITTRKDYKTWESKPSIILFRGKLKYIPRVGEYVTLWDGWCAQIVYEVWHSIYDNSATIVLDTVDDSNEYLNEATKRKIKQWK